MAETVDDVACTLGLILCNGVNVDLGVTMLAAHGRRSKVLSSLCRIDLGVDPVPNPAHVFAQLERSEVGLDLAEAWLANDDPDFQKAGRAFIAILKSYEAMIPDDGRARLDQLLEASPSLAALMAPESRLRIADFFAEHRRSSLAVTQYALVTGSSDAEAMDDRTLERLAAMHRAAAEHDQASKCLVVLVKRHPESDQWRLELGICRVLAGAYAEAQVFLMSVSDSTLHGESWSWALTASIAAKIAGPSQARQPAGAEAALRRRSVGTGSYEDWVKLFGEAAQCDAVAVSTWTLYFGALGSEKPPLGGLGVVPLAVLSWDDPEWWALALSVLTLHGHVEAFLRVAECALRAIGDRFPTQIEEGFSPSGFADADLAEFVSGIAKLKADGGPLHVREIPPAEKGGRATSVIEPAPVGFRLFDLDLPPVETWFEGPLDTELS